MLPGLIILISAATWLDLVWTAWIQPCVKSPGKWCNGVGNDFLAHTDSLNTNRASFKCYSLSVLLLAAWPWTSHVHPFMTNVLSYNGYFQHNAPYRKIQVILNGFNEHNNECTLMASPVTSSEFNRAPLGWGRTADLQQGCAADICSDYKMQSCKH